MNKNKKIIIPNIICGSDYRTLNDDKLAADLLYQALKQGFRAIDTTWMYGTESIVGDVVTQCLDEGWLKREDIFIQTKVPHIRQGYNCTLEVFEESLQKLKTNYVDSYLIHYPLTHEQNYMDLLIDTWRAMEKLYKDGKIKNLGICNVSTHHLDYLLSKAEIMPAICQIQLHPQHQQKNTVEYCKKHNIIVEAWAPLYSGELCKNTTICDIAKKYSKSAAQVILNWHKAKGIIPITKPSNENEINENINSYDFELTQEDICTIDKLDYGKHHNLFDYDTDYITNNVMDDTEIWDYKLFGIISVITKKTSRWKTKYYLFNIPILKITTKKRRKKNRIKLRYKIEPIYTKKKHFFESCICYKDELVAFEDYTNKKIIIYNLKTKKIKTYRRKNELGCIVFIDNSTILSAEKNGIYKINLKSGKDELCQKLNLPQNMRCNDGKLDAKGRFIFGTFSNKNDGFLYCYENGNLRVLLDKISCSNGIAWNSNNTKMYYTDSVSKKIGLYNYDIKSGNLQFVKYVIDLNVIAPDGICTDADNNLWIAEFNGLKVSKWDTKTYKKTDEINFPANCTSCYIGGENMQYLFVTTAPNINYNPVCGLYKIKIR